MDSMMESGPESGGAGRPAVRSRWSAAGWSARASLARVASLPEQGPPVPLPKMLMLMTLMLMTLMMMTLMIIHTQSRASLGPNFLPKVYPTFFC